MDIFDVLFHPFFYIPLFLLLGLIVIFTPIFIKKPRIKLILAGIVVTITVIIMIPYVYAMVIWFLVNKLHWIR